MRHSLTGLVLEHSASGWLRATVFLLPSVADSWPVLLGGCRLVGHGDSGGPAGTANPIESLIVSNRQDWADTAPGMAPAFLLHLPSLNYTEEANMRVQMGRKLGLK